MRPKTEIKVKIWHSKQISRTSTHDLIELKDQGQQIQENASSLNRGLSELYASKLSMGVNINHLEQIAQK